MLKLLGKRLHRLDGVGLNVKGKGGGVCVYLPNPLSGHCTLNLELSTQDFEIICLDITKPGLKYMSFLRLYRPPTGKIKSCTEYLKSIFQICKNEIWILGDFNVDFIVS